MKILIHSSLFNVTESFARNSTVVHTPNVILNKIIEIRKLYNIVLKIYSYF